MHLKESSLIFLFVCLCAETHLSRSDRTLHGSLHGEQSVTRYTTVTNYIFRIIIAVVAFVIALFESPTETELDTLSDP